MKVTINKGMFRQDKKILFWGIILVTVALFFLTNMHQMVLSKNYDASSQEIIKQYFSLAPFKNCILYFIYAILACFLLKSLDVLIKGIEEDKYSFEEIFLTKISELSLISVVSFLSITMLKTAVFFLRRAEFKALEIGEIKLLMFFLLSLAMALLMNSIIIAGMLTVKNKFYSIIIVPFFLYCLFLFFGFFNMFLSNYLWPLKWIIDKVGKISVDNFVMILASDFRIELKPLSYQIISLATIVSFAVTLYCVDYFIFSNLNSQRLENTFYFESVRKLSFIMVAFIGAFTLLAGVDLVTLVFIPKHFDIINLFMSIGAIISEVLFYKLITKNNLSCDE